MPNYLKPGDDVETIITRPSSTTLLAISSNDRYSSWSQRRTSPTNPFSFVIQKNQALMNGYFRRIALTEFRMNWTLPNIATAWGNNAVNISYITSGTTYTFVVQLSDGFYGAEELSTALQILIQSGNGGVSGIAGFQVRINSSSEDDIMQFIAPSGTTFWFSPIANQQQRQLFDMLALPSMVSPGVSSFISGVPDLRATEYVDIVCSQLTNNMHQKDSTSAPIVRDMLARIYLDDDVPSQATITTNYYNTTYASTTSSTYALINANTVSYTVASTTGFTIGDYVSVSGLTGGTNWTGSNVGIVQGIIGSILEIYYGATVSGTPTGTATITATNQGALTQTSTPQTTWDDRVNGITPFVLYRQFPYPKQIRWEHTAPIGNLRFEMFDSQGRAVSDLWSQFSSGTAISPIVSTGTSVISSAISVVNSVSGQPLQLLYTVGSTTNFKVGDSVSVSGVSVANYNQVVQVVQVNSSTQLTVLYPTAFSGVPSVSGAKIINNRITYGVSSSTGFSPTQFVFVSGLDNSSGANSTGFDGQATVVSTPTASTVVVQYSTLLSGTIPTVYTYAVMNNTLDYQSSFAWNTSLLCSED